MRAMEGVASQVMLEVKDPLANARDIRDTGSILGSERSPGGGHGNPLQCSCLENSMYRGAWQATVYRVTASWTRLKRMSMCRVMGLSFFPSAFPIMSHFSQQTIVLMLVIWTFLQRTNFRLILTYCLEIPVLNNRPHLEQCSST